MSRFAALLDGEAAVSGTAMVSGTAAVSGTTAELCLLDTFRLVAGREVQLAPQLERLLAFLAIHGGASRYVIADVVWPDLPERSSLAALRTAAWRIHQQVPGVLWCNRRTMALGPGVAVDVSRLVSWARQVIANPRLVPDPALTFPVVGAELLPGWYEDWLDLDRRRLHQMRLHAMEAAAEEMLRRGRTAEAMLGAHELLRADPLRESSHRLIVRIHLAEGNVRAALDQFMACGTMLRREIGVPPSGEMLGLVSPYLSSAWPAGYPPDWR